MICSNCNTMNADGVKFCGNCGAPLGIMQPGPQTQQPQTRTGNSRLHLLLSILAFLWYPMMAVLWLVIFMIVAASNAGAVSGAGGTPGAARQIQNVVTAVSVGALLITALLGVVVRVGSLVVSIRAMKRHYPYATITLVLSVLALIGALFVDFFIVIFGILGPTA